MMNFVDYLLQELKVGRLGKDDAVNFLTQCRDCTDKEHPHDSRLHPLLERNRHFATTNAREGASILARHPGPGLVRSGTILSATITVAREDS